MCSFFTISKLHVNKCNCLEQEKHYGVFLAKAQANSELAPISPSCYFVISSDTFSLKGWFSNTISSFNQKFNQLTLAWLCQLRAFDHTFTSLSDTSIVSETAGMRCNFRQLFLLSNSGPISFRLHRLDNCLLGFQNLSLLQFHFCQMHFKRYFY